MQRTPAELLFGFNPRVEDGDKSVEDIIRRGLLANFGTEGNSIGIASDHGYHATDKVLPPLFSLIVSYLLIICVFLSPEK
jgi:hypothetical protein